MNKCFLQILLKALYRKGNVVATKITCFVLEKYVVGCTYYTVLQLLTVTNALTFRLNAMHLHHAKRFENEMHTTIYIPPDTLYDFQLLFKLSFH